MTEKWLATVLVPVRNYGMAEGEQCWELQYRPYPNKRTALMDLSVGMKSGTMHPIALRTKDKVWGVLDIMAELGVLIKQERVCMDHGMPAPWCRCGV